MSAHTRCRTGTLFPVATQPTRNPPHFNSSGNIRPFDTTPGLEEPSSSLVKALLTGPQLKGPQQLRLLTLSPRGAAALVDLLGAMAARGLEPPPGWLGAAQLALAGCCDRSAGAGWGLGFPGVRVQGLRGPRLSGGHGGLVCVAFCGAPGRRCAGRQLHGSAAPRAAGAACPQRYAVTF
jgi:hypothetical protein